MKLSSNSKKLILFIAIDIWCLYTNVKYLVRDIKKLQKEKE